MNDTDALGTVHRACPPRTNPFTPSTYVLVCKTCSESLENMCPRGFIKNYQHAMQRVEITIMRCPCDVIAFSIPRVFNPPPAPASFYPSLSILWNCNHSRKYTNDFCIMYSFIDSTYTHMVGRLSFQPLSPPKLLHFLLLLVKWKLKLHCFN